MWPWIWTIPCGKAFYRDDGPNNVRIRHDRLYILKLLKARGIMIAMVSKNDPADIPVIEGLLNVKQIGTLYDVPNPFADEMYPYKDLFVNEKDRLDG